MIRILQINKHRSATAYELLAHYAAETKADFVLISEQYRNKDPASWHLNISSTAEQWVRDGTLLRVLTQSRGDGFVWIHCSRITFYSIYLMPNETMPNFLRRLDALEEAILSTDIRILIGGDFNSRVLEWRMLQTDSRGKRTWNVAKVNTGGFLKTLGISGAALEGTPGVVALQLTLS